MNIKNKISNLVISSVDSMQAGKYFKDVNAKSDAIKEKLSNIEESKRVFIPKTFGRSFARAGYEFPASFMAIIMDRISNAVEYSKNGHSKTEKARKWALLTVKVAALSVVFAASFLAVPVASVVYATKALAGYKKAHEVENI